MVCMQQESLSSTNYEVVIEPNSAWLRLDWRQIVEFRDLLMILVRRDFVSKFRQTILGPAWFILQPLLTTIVFTIVFTQIARIPTDGVPPILFYLCGLLGWNYFAQNVNHTANTFAGNAQLFTKVYFPRLIVPLSMTVSNLIAYGIQLVTFALFYLYYKAFTSAAVHLHVRLEVLLLPLLILQTAILSLGVGLWLSVLTAKYRDFTHLLGLVVQLWLYATPVIYPVSQLPPHLTWLVTVNPMAPILETYRFIFFSSPPTSLLRCSLSIFTTLLVFFTGLMLFQRTERDFVDTV